MMLRRFKKNERGVALITVMGMAGVLFVITTTIAIQSLNNLRQAGGEKRYEQTIQVADAGLERGLFELNKTTPNLPSTTFSTTTFASASAERDYVISVANAAATSSPATRLFSTPEGQFVIVKPSNIADRIYSVGYVPSFAAAAANRKIRVIRATYGIGPIPAKYAILSRGDLTLGNVHTSIKGGSVHANGNLTVTGHGKVDGFVTSSGGFTNSEPNKLKFGDSINSGGGRPAVDVPMLKPIDYYANSHYDLCPDGTVRPGPKYPGTPKNTTTTPCNAGLSALPIDSKTGFRGWFFNGSSGTHGPIWQFKSKKAYDGVYYVHNGSAYISEKTKKWNVTVYASATGADCSLTGGDIIVRNGKSSDWNAHPDGGGVLFLAGRDFDFGNVYASGVDKKDFANGRAHVHHMTGIVYAYEQFRIGKDHFELEGSVVSYGASGCNSTGSPASTNVSGHPHIEWAGTLTIPTDRVRITQWEEL
jgi:hypothetical protein